MYAGGNTLPGFLVCAWDENQGELKVSEMLNLIFIEGLGK